MRRGAAGQLHQHTGSGNHHTPSDDIAGPIGLGVARGGHWRAAIRAGHPQRTDTGGHPVDRARNCQQTSHETSPNNNQAGHHPRQLTSVVATRDATAHPQPQAVFDCPVSSSLLVAGIDHHVQVIGRGAGAAACGASSSACSG